MQLFSVYAIIAQAYQFVWQERCDLVALAMLPVVVSALIGAGLLTFSDGAFFIPGKDGTVVGIKLLFYLYLAVLILCYVMFAVGWCRKRILEHQTPTVAESVLWDRQKTLFLARLLLLGVLTMVVALPPALGLALLSQSVPALGALAAFAAPAGFMTGCLFFPRASLWLIAAAVEDPVSFRTLWEETRGHGWWLLLITVLPPLPIFLFQAIVSVAGQFLLQLTAVADSMTVYLLFFLFDQSASYGAAAVGLAAIAAAYKMLHRFD